MKKTICFFAFCFLLSAFSLNAQYDIQLEDSSFETGWKNQTGAYGPFENYETAFFYTLNELHARPNEPTPAPCTAFKDGNAQQGNYCIKLTSRNMPVGETYVFLPGLVGTINKGFIEEFIGSGGNVTMTRDWDGYDTPQALEGWFKYNPVNGDSALIDIGFYDWNGEVFISKMIIRETVNDWTSFRVLIPEQYWDREFSQIRVLFVASAGVNFNMLMLCEGQLGSTLWIDNIALNYKLGIKQSLFSSLQAKAFPNPITDILNLELNEPFTGKIMVYNSLGSLVMEENINGSQCQLNASALATGNYIYKLMNGNTIFAQDKFIVVK